MTAQIIDGRQIADRLLARVAARVEQRLAEGLARPGLAVILVGDDPASAVYVQNKRRACARVGIAAFDYNLPAGISEAALLALIRKLNGVPEVDGILVQLPLPPSINTQRVIEAIDPNRDVDGFHAENLGRLMLRWPGLRPCTPRGVMTLLGHIDVAIRGQRAVVVGASNHVGRPLAMELMIAGATVTVCHRFTTDLASEVARADLVAVAVGKPGLIRASWIKPGAVVIDVGINRLADGRLVGDVEPEARERAGYLTPVPGGVGPMTVATLMVNVLEAAEQRLLPVQVS